MPYDAPTKICHATRRTWCPSACKGIGLAMLVAACAGGGSNAARPEPPPTDRAPRKVEATAPKQLETTTGYSAHIARGMDLYLPPWFSADRGGYDLIVHFHGESRWQRANVERAHLNAAIVSVNLGVGTEPYSQAFKQPRAFEQLLERIRQGVVKSGQPDDVRERRIALTSWSAGFSAIARLLNDSVATRIDAILLSDGFFTFFTDTKKRVVHREGLEKFARFARAAERGDKLFTITHTSIPTGPYPSVQECTAALLQMLSLSKTPSSDVGPLDMKQIYVVDSGHFHVRGYRGVTAPDHVRQLHAMGEVVYPWLSARWAN